MTTDTINADTFAKRQKDLGYPSAPRKPSLSYNPTASEAREYADMMDAYEVELTKHKELKDKYQKESKRINDEFKQWAIESAGLKDHPRADKVYNLAWENGHASGYSEVYYHLIDIAEVLID